MKLNLEAIKQHIFFKRGQRRNKFQFFISKNIKVIKRIRAKYGYRFELDYIPPTQTQRTLSDKEVEELFIRVFQRYKDFERLTPIDEDSITILDIFTDYPKRKILLWDKYGELPSIYTCAPDHLINSIILIYSPKAEYYEVID